ncbi:MAG TPA: SCO family protein [Gammaproteobacteria bacterium]
MKKSNLSSYLIGLVAIIAMAAGVWLGYQTQSDNHLQPPQIQGVILPKPKPLTNIQLLNHDNEAITENSLKGKWSIVFVGYTHCPDVCPTTLSVLTQMYSLMLEQDIAPPQVVFISIDPERDNPDLLKQYVKYFNPDFIGATGNNNQLTSVTQQLNVVYTKVAGTSGDVAASDYLMDHSSTLLLINPDGHLQSYLTAPHTPMKIIESILFSQEYFKEVHTR